MKFKLNHLDYKSQIFIIKLQFINQKVYTHFTMKIKVYVILIKSFELSNLVRHLDKSIHTIKL